MAKYLTDLADVLRKAGLTVVEIPGWKTRGRPGDFNPKGVLCHHTAGPGDGYDDAYYMAVTGRTDLSAPLAQLALSRKGVWYVLAAGRANHAGKCKAVGGLTAGDGNEQLIGVEAQNRGTDAEDWSPTQYRAYVRGVAALTEHYRWRAPLGHKETSLSGKVDPDFDMNKFRRDVAAADLQEEDMPLTDADAAKLLTGTKVVPSLMLEGEETVSVARALDLVMRWSLAGRNDAAAARAIAEAQAASSKPLTAEQIEAAAAAGVAKALSEKAQIDVVVKGATA